MSPSRRDFMRGVGVSLAGLITSSCGARTCYVPLPPTGTISPLVQATPALDFSQPSWAQLRELWYSLDELAKTANDLDAGRKALEQLIAQHQAAINALVESHELNANVADEMQRAFSEAAWHVWRSHAPIMCYVPAPYPDYELQSRADLQRQAELLEEMATKSNIDEATVQEALAAIKRDMAYMMLGEDERKAIREEAMKASDQIEWPSLTELELEIPDECREAAEILVALLLANK